MKFHRIFLISFFIVISLSFSGLCSEYWVDVNNGSDTNSGLSSDNPLKTITYTLSLVSGTESDPAVIHISEGTYNQSSGEIFPLEMKDFMTIKGSGKDLTIIDGQNTGGVIIYLNK